MKKLILFISIFLLGSCSVNKVNKNIDARLEVKKEIIKANKRLRKQNRIINKIHRKKNRKIYKLQKKKISWEKLN